MNDAVAPSRLKRGLPRWAGAVLVAAVAVLSPVVLSAPADAAACSSSNSQSTCTVGTSTTVTGGSLGVSAPGTLYWSFVQSGYDQVESGSSTALTSCTASGSATSCSSGTNPVLLVTDATGSGTGWALSAYVSSSNLPANTVLRFNGAGASAGASVAGSSLAGATPTAVCDFNSSCTSPTAATSCSHSSQGFTSCPSYGVTIPLTGGSSTAQTDLYSAAASSGLGALCFGSGTVTATGCTGTTSTALFNMKMPAAAAQSTYTGAVINLTASSGP